MTNGKSVRAAALSLAAAAFGASPALAGGEAFKAGGEAEFLRGAASLSQARFSPAALLHAAVASGPSIDQYLRVVSPAPQSGTLAGAATEVSLSALLNNNLRTGLIRPLGGASVEIGGAFNLANQTFMSVKEGAKVGFYNLQTILEADPPMQATIGSAQYDLMIQANPANPLASKIVFTNHNNGSDRQTVTLDDMLKAVRAAGKTLSLAGDEYKLYYSDDVQNSKARFFTLITLDAKGAYLVYPIPEGLVPSDKVAVFKLNNDKTVGLQIAGGNLRIYNQ